MIDKMVQDAIAAARAQETLREKEAAERSVPEDNSISGILSKLANEVRTAQVEPSATSQPTAQVDRTKTAQALKGLTLLGRFVGGHNAA